MLAAVTCFINLGAVLSCCIISVLCFKLFFKAQKTWSTSSLDDYLVSHIFLCTASSFVQNFMLAWNNNFWFVLYLEIYWVEYHSLRLSPGLVINLKDQLSLLLCWHGQQTVFSVHKVLFQIPYELYISSFTVKQCSRRYLCRVYLLKSQK